MPTVGLNLNINRLNTPIIRNIVRLDLLNPGLYTADNRNVQNIVQRLKVQG